jgi:hypothetical protein
MQDCSEPKALVSGPLNASRLLISLLIILFSQIPIIGSHLKLSNNAIDGGVGFLLPKINNKIVHGFSFIIYIQVKRSRRISSRCENTSAEGRHLATQYVQDHGANLYDKELGNIEEPIEEPIKEPIEEPIEEPIKEPVKEPVEELAEEPTNSGMKDISPPHAIDLTPSVPPGERSLSQPDLTEAWI